MQETGFFLCRKIQFVTDRPFKFADAELSTGCEGLCPGLMPGSGSKSAKSIDLRSIDMELAWGSVEAEATPIVNPIGGI